MHERTKEIAMKTKIALLLTTVFLTIPAYARHGYFGIRGGFTETRETEIIDKYEATGFGSGYIGAYNGPFRVEAEYTLTGKTEYDNTHTTAQFQRIMANSYIDLPVSRYVRPYIGAGVGTAYYSIKDTQMKTKETGNNFTWNATAGIGIKLTRNVTFDSGYRYVDMGDITVQKQDMHFDTQEVYAGLRFLF